MVTLALNVADPLVAGEHGKAAFDAVGPLLLLGWAEVGPAFLQALGTTSTAANLDDKSRTDQTDTQVPGTPTNGAALSHNEQEREQSRSRHSKHLPDEELLDQARREDAAHRMTHQKPISADGLRLRLGIGSAKARLLVKTVRSEFQTRGASRELSDDRTPVSGGSATTLAAW